MKKHIFLFVAFACVGITAEIFFTAIRLNIGPWSEVDWSLKGQSYIWMFPIYGIAGIVFPLLVPFIQKIPFIFRMCIYAIGILIVEFIAGGLLDFFTGKCLGNIQLDGM